MFFLIKRYEICMNTGLTLHPAYFDLTKWTKAKYATQLVPVLQQMATYVGASSRVENVTYQCFSFDSAAARANWKASLDVPHRDLSKLGRQVQIANDTVNLYFDLEETLEAQFGAADMNDIKRSTFNVGLSASSLGQNRDLLAAALKLQF